MSQLRKRKMQSRAAALVRDFYESLLMLMLSLFLQVNQWHIVHMLNSSQLPDEMSVEQQSTFSWSTIFFSSGLLLTLLQYRPGWMRRRLRPLRKLLLVVELFVVLFLVDYILLAMWLPFLNLVQQALHTLGHSNWTWVRLIFHNCPSLCAWMINDAFHTVRFATSVTWFLLAFQTAGKLTHTHTLIAGSSTNHK